MSAPRPPRYASFQDLARSVGRDVAPSGRPVVCIQGLGFVGAAMAVATAAARDRGPHFDVVGVDLPTPDGLAKVAALNAGRLPMASADPKLARAVAEAHAAGNLIATTDTGAYGLASVTVVNVPLDVARDGGSPRLDLEPFRRAIGVLGREVPPGSLIIVETTVPPGACEKVAAPILAQCMRERGLGAEAILLAHSYERVMPGAAYFDSIANFWRVYSGHTAAAADACQAFLEKVIDTRKYPLRRVASTTASETGKVLENSYRAVTIALMEEWGRFAEAVGIDLFEVIEAIRVRPTHSNMRQPGFGVGGYCLTKDPLFAELAAQELFGRPDLRFTFSTQAVSLNQAMPLVSLDKIEALTGVRGKRLLLLGVSYRQDVGDTRYSPSEIFVREAQRRGATVACHDPLLRHWPELDLALPERIPSPAGFDVVVFAVPHREYTSLDLPGWLGTARPLVFDANNVLGPGQRAALQSLGCATAAIGRGDRRG